jgi:predicted nicotinamide N-methyase
MGFFLRKNDIRGKNLVDIGAGIGFTTALALQSGANFVWLQDLPVHFAISSRLWHFQKTMMSMNGIDKSHFDRLPLSWGDFPDKNFPAVDILISSDSFYEKQSIRLPFA